MGRETQAGGSEVRVFCRADVREVDRLAVAEFGIPSIVLMENASRHLADVALDIAESEAADVLVVCGPGNNGGDGLGAARHLANAGASVRIVLSGPADRYKGDAATNLAIVRKMKLPIHEAAERTGLRAGAAGPEIVIDALLGTGLERTVEEPLARLIHAVNELAGAGSHVVSADLPSGMDCDTGEALGVAVRAGTTVSFVGLKAGFLKLAAQEYLGDVVVADIGAPVELVRRLGRSLADHELHDGPGPRPGHVCDGPEEPHRKERG